MGIMGPLQLTITWYKVILCWRVSNALGQANQNDFNHSCVAFLCFECPRAELALQHGGFCTM